MNKELLVKAIRDKMFLEMSEQKIKFSDTYFSVEIGISKATLSRVLNFKEVDLNTLISICKWLDQPIDNFINLKKNHNIMKNFKKLIPALILVAVVVFIAIALPSVIHNIIQDAITKR